MRPNLTGKVDRRLFHRVRAVSAQRPDGPAMRRPRGGKL
jgi:hypothetical protein